MTTCIQWLDWSFLSLKICNSAVAMTAAKILQKHIWYNLGVWYIQGFLEATDSEQCYRIILSEGCSQGPKCCHLHFCTNSWIAISRHEKAAQNPEIHSFCVPHCSPYTWNISFSSAQAVLVTAAKSFNVWVSPGLKKRIPLSPDKASPCSQKSMSCEMKLKNNIHLSLLLRKEIIYSFMHLCHLLADIPEACWRNRGFHFILEINTQPVNSFLPLRNVPLEYFPRETCLSRIMQISEESRKRNHKKWNSWNFTYLPLKKNNPTTS